MSVRQRKSRLLSAALSLSLLFAAGLPSSLSSQARAADEDKPDLSDYIPRSSKLSYGKDKELEKLQKDLEKEKAGRATVHTVTTCKDFLKLFEKEKTLQRFDTIRINFKSTCEIKETVTVTKGIRIEHASAITDDKFTPFYTQQAMLDPSALVGQRETVFRDSFLCNTRAAPCFLIDTPDGQRTTITGLKFRVKEALFAPLIQARSGYLTASHNFFSGSTIDTGTARQGPALMAENQSATIIGNTFLRTETAIKVYPYMAMRSGEFEDAFKIGRNVIDGSYAAIELDGTYRFGPRPEVKVYVYGNLAFANSVAIMSRDVRAFHFRNILQDNGTHMDMTGGESLVEQNIFRYGGTGIFTGRQGPVYLESNLFEGLGAGISNVLDFFESGSPYPINNICRNQDLASQYQEDLTVKKILKTGGWSEVPLGKRWGRKHRIEKEFAAAQQANVQSHILFARPFELNPADGYKNCFDYSSVIALDSGQLDKFEAKAHLRPSRENDFFD
ncbi:MAG: hypothetical protein EP347_02840 [Alphaproteobacteria bacterium]|nr:MAG: hypothetical protein EP347_02840 [Alphaproteobacteria bacterium]